MKRIPMFFIDSDDGMASAAFGSAEEMSHAITDCKAYFEEALNRLVSGRDGDVVTLTIERKDMTWAEVAALPEE